jgi:hypothetical protein
MSNRLAALSNIWQYHQMCRRAQIISKAMSLSDLSVPLLPDTQHLQDHRKENSCFPQQHYFAQFAEARVLVGDLKAKAYSESLPIRAHIVSHPRCK